MNYKNKVRISFNIYQKSVNFYFLIILIILYLTAFPLRTLSLEKNLGEHLFVKHCAGCHINGGNIIRRNKTLKLKDLHKNGIDTPEAIAKIAREGIGSMSGYKDVLGEKGEEIVAKWVWDQSQNAWIQG